MPEHKIYSTRDDHGNETIEFTYVSEKKESPKPTMDIDTEAALIEYFDTVLICYRKLFDFAEELLTKVSPFSMNDDDYARWEEICIEFDTLSEYPDYFKEDMP